MNRQSIRLTKLTNGKRKDDLSEQIIALKNTVEDLNNKIEKIEKQFYLGSDDQIFVGALLTFVTVFLNSVFSKIIKN